MEDLRRILTEHQTKSKSDTLSTKPDPVEKGPSWCEIPELFFDQILVDFKLNRQEIMTLMYLYRMVWTRPNLHKAYGIGPIMALSEVAKHLDTTYEKLHECLTKLEHWGFIETIRPGQYFVRKYFTRDNDKNFLQTYEDFE
jgi:hypothetical protein